MKARDFDKKFDEGANFLKALDLSKAKRPGQEQRRVNVDFPMDDQATGQGSRSVGRNKTVGNQNMAGGAAG